jgi:hypothetical protein
MGLWQSLPLLAFVFVLLLLELFLDLAPVLFFEPPLHFGFGESLLAEIFLGIVGARVVFLLFVVAFAALAAFLAGLNNSRWYRLGRCECAVAFLLLLALGIPRHPGSLIHEALEVVSDRGQELRPIEDSLDVAEDNS